MRGTILLLAAAGLLAGCSQAGAAAPPSPQALSPSTTAPSPSAAATTTPAADLAAQGNCQHYELAYGIVRTNLSSSDTVLGQAAEMATTAPSLQDPASKAGADAGVALADLAQQGLLLRIDATYGRPLNRGPFTEAWDRAKAACTDVGYHFSV